MSYIGNEQEWKRLMAVDWLGQYVKAWIAFNAWYRNKFEQSNDREIIDAIKNDEGDICSKIEGRLINSSAGDKSFQSEVADLHYLLLRTVIKSNEKKSLLNQSKIISMLNLLNIKKIRLPIKSKYVQTRKRGLF